MSRRALFRAVVIALTPHASIPRGVLRRKQGIGLTTGGNTVPETLIKGGTSLLLSHILI